MVDPFHGNSTMALPGLSVQELQPPIPQLRARQMHPTLRPGAPSYILSRCQVTSNREDEPKCPASNAKLLYRYMNVHIRIHTFTYKQIHTHTHISKYIYVHVSRIMKNNSVPPRTYNALQEPSTTFTVPQAPHGTSGGLRYPATRRQLSPPSS